MFDLRLPIGGFFLLIGVTLAVVGLTGVGARAPLSTANVSLWTGMAMILFGAWLVMMARRAKR